MLREIFFDLILFSIKNEPIAINGFRKYYTHAGKQNKKARQSEILF